MPAEQGTVEWEQQRLGKLTASRFHDAIDTLKGGGWKKSRRDYMLELAAERLTGMRKDPYMNAAMLWGVESEPLARQLYEAHRGEVQSCGFVNHAAILMSGASPDGIVGTDGLVEFKCPNSDTHLATLLERAIPDEYQTQIQWQLACTGRSWCDYCTFDSRMPEHLRIGVIRLLRDETRITQLEALAVDFLDELERIVAALRTGSRYTPEWLRPRLSGKVAHVASEDIADAAYSGIVFRKPAE